MNQINKWLNYLEKEEIYDNTRIILVSDHGGSYRNGRSRAGMENYNPILMIKDFDERGKLKSKNDIMTHADTPYLALRDLNIASGIVNDDTMIKKNKITVFSAVSSQPLRHGPYTFNLTRKRDFKGRNVLRERYWSEWESY